MKDEVDDKKTIEKFKSLVKHLQELLVCYRLGKRPSDKCLEAISKEKEWLGLS